MANGESSHVTPRATKLPVNMGEQEVLLDVLVLPELEWGVILGRPWLHSQID